LSCGKDCLLGEGEVDSGLETNPTKVQCGCSRVEKLDKFKVIPIVADLRFFIAGWIRGMIVKL